MGEGSVFSRAINTRNIWEHVIKAWCCEDVVKTFMSLKSKDARDKMVDAFKAKVMQLSMEQAKKHHIERLVGTSFADPIIPLSSDEVLLQEAIKLEGSLFNIDDFDAVRYDLMKWGKKKGNKELIKEHGEKSSIFKAKFVNNNKTRKTSPLQLINTLSTDTTVTKHQDQPGRKTKNLKAICIEDLKLFETCIGCSLEGTLVGYGRLMVGITLLLEDSFGDVIQLAIYNVIPDGPDKYVIAEKYFPHGRRIKIIEPFMKIFRDGNRGIRVDKPDDVCFIDDDRYRNYSIDEIRVIGKRLMETEQYSTAFELYKNCLQSDSTPHLVSLLNNRSQTELKLENYEEALLDAASVLFFEVDNEKAKYRYDVALKRIQSNCKDNDEIWKQILEKINILENKTEIDTEKTKIEGKIVGTDEHIGTKETGNKYFAACQYHLALKEYTSAINFPDISLLLTNMAIASIQLNMFQTSIAACSACLRITKDKSRRQKALYLMSKSFIKLQKLSFYQEYLSPLIVLKKELDKMCFDISNSQNKIKQTLETIDNKIFSPHSKVSLTDIKKLMAETKTFRIESEFLQPNTLEHVYIKGKGRGIRALRDIKARTILLVDQLVIGKATEICETTTFRTSYNYNNKRLISDGDLKLKKELLNRNRHDGLLFKRLKCLEHRQNACEHRQNAYGQNASLPLLDLEKFSSHYLDEIVPPFLSQSNEVLGNHTNSIDQIVIQNIISVNTFSHGSIHSLDDITDGSALSMRISLLNHDDDAFNCRALPFNDAMVLFSIKDIPKGDELTIYYKDDCKFSEMNGGF